MEEPVFKVVREGKDYSVIDDALAKAFVAVIEDYYNKKSWWRFRGANECKTFQRASWSIFPKR